MTALSATEGSVLPEAIETTHPRLPHTGGRESAAVGSRAESPSRPPQARGQQTLTVVDICCAIVVATGTSYKGSALLSTDEGLIAHREKGGSAPAK